MAIESDLYKQLSEDANIVNLVGDKIYPLKKPQNVKPPYIVYHIISDLDKQCMGGDVYLNDVRVQIDIYSNTYSSVIQILEEVKNSILGFKSSNSINSFDGYDSSTEYFKKILDFKLRD